jgi:hypothetical protein
MRALSIRQPYAELILRRIKTVEYRSRPTRIIGERFFIYASKRSAFSGQRSAKAWSHDLSTMSDPPQWMIELAQQVGMIEPGTLLPTGVIVGSAVIEKVSDLSGGFYGWHLADVQRIDHPRKPRKHPQPVWFKPFG